VLYGIAPYYFARGHNRVAFQEIERRLPEIKELGANVIWIMSPLASAQPGQGYDTTDHFAISSEFGTEADLKALITTAHALDLKVILDLALNHTSIRHPFAKDVIAKGEESEHNDFYQHEALTGIPYAQHFHHLKRGATNFIYYFWNELVNLNYSNPRVQEYALKVAEHWLSRLDHDGYRFDASWGPSSRWPDFYKTMSARLRKIKPDIFLIAEDRAGYPVNYKDTNHPHLKSSDFDAAYDWSATDPDMLSKWSFAIDGEDTIFNFGDKTYAAKHFRKILREAQTRQELPALRYLENNDTASFDRHHSMAQLKWAAKTVYSLPGPILIFYGQAEGLSHDQWNLPSLDPKRKLSSYNPTLWRFYKKLIQRHQKFDEELSVEFSTINSQAIQFNRTIGEQKIKFVVDFKNQRTTAEQ
jgi:glycosidase